MKATARLELDGVSFADLSLEHEPPDKPGWRTAVEALRGLATTIEVLYDDEKFPPRFR